LAAQVADELRIRRSEGPEGFAVGLLPVQVLALDGDLGDLPLVDGGQEVAENHLLIAGWLLREDVHEQENHENEEEPERQIPRELVHRSVTFAYRHDGPGEGTMPGTP